MNIYEIDIIKNFQGFQRIEPYIEASYHVLSCEKCEHSPDPELFHKPRELHTFLTLSFTKLNCIKSNFDDAKEVNNIYISVLPSFNDSKPDFIIIFNSNKLNKSFIMSKIDLHKIYPNLIELNEFKSLKENNIFGSMEYSYEFVENIFDKSLCHLIPVKNNKKEILENKQESENLINDKFNLSDYEMIK